jgi:hypothetical protein
MRHMSHLCGTLEATNNFFTKIRHLLVLVFTA